MNALLHLLFLAEEDVSVAVPPASCLFLSEEIFPILQSFIHITHVFPPDAVSSILAAEQQQCEQQNAFYETTKKNEQNHRRKGGLSRDVIE